MKCLITLLVMLVSILITAQELYKKIPEELLVAGNSAQLKTSDNTASYDVKYYRLEWTVDPVSNPASINGNVTAYWEAVEPMNMITFDLANNMNVSQVIQRSDSLTYTHIDNELVITLPNTQDASVFDSLTIVFGGNPNSFFYEQKTHNEIPVLWAGNGNNAEEIWWPCKSGFKDRVDSIDVIVTHPQFYNNHEYKTASIGVMISETINDSIKTTHWKHKYPILAFSVGIAVTNYSVYYENAYEGTDREFPIINYVFPEHLADVQQYTSVTADIIELYGELFGMYPFANEKYGHAEIIADYGIEFSTVGLMGFFNDREIIAHELAHQWFGSLSIYGSWEDIWLGDGFATYLDLLTREHLDGNEAFINKRKEYVKDIVVKNDGSVFCSDTTSLIRINDYRLSYKKASMVLHMLRYKLGDADFFSAIQNYITDPEIAFSYNRTIDLQNHFEAQSGMDLDEFFADWYYGEGYPSYQLEWYQNGDSAYFIINQTQSHSSVSFFEMPLPIKVNGSYGQSQWLRFENTENGQQFIEYIGFPITSVDFDPQFELISDNNTVEPYTGIKEIKKKCLSIYPNPSNDIINIAVENTNNATIEFYTLNSKLVLNKAVISKIEKIDVSGISEGMYVVKVKQSDNVYVGKVVVK